MPLAVGTTQDPSLRQKPNFVVFTTRSLVCTAEANVLNNPGYKSEGQPPGMFLNKVKRE
jgi:hypothetical protein